MILQKIAHGILRLMGWTIIGEVPDLKKAVLVAAPHTSNWDGFLLLVYKVAIDLDVSFFAKHSLFWWPLSAILNALGAIPVDRSKKSGSVEQAIEKFAHEERFFLAMAPEGTRRWKPYWRTGFYHIAMAAKVPVVMGYADYKEKKLGLVKLIELTGNPAKDLEVMREFYAPITPRRPENMAPIEFPPSMYEQYSAANKPAP